MESKNSIKFCPKCRIEKNTADFPKNRTRPDGLHCYCKICNNEGSQKYRKETKYHLNYYSNNKKYFQEKNKEYKSLKKDHIYNQRKNYGLIKNYGISFDEKIKMCDSQDYKCKICEVALKENKLVVDHDHKTNKIRGLLCGKCNAGIGFLKENKEILLRAIAYLDTEII